MKRLSFVVLACALSMVLFAKAKQPITFEALPQIVQEEVQKNFEVEQIQFITSEKVFKHTCYTFSVNDGTQMEYNELAGLLAVKNAQGVDSVFVPEKIFEYIKKTFPNATITEYKYETYKQEVELNNKLELIFDRRGSFLRIDE